MIIYTTILYYSHILTATLPVNYNTSIPSIPRFTSIIQYILFYPFYYIYSTILFKIKLFDTPLIPRVAVKAALNLSGRPPIVFLLHSSLLTYSRVSTSTWSYLC